MTFSSKAELSKRAAKIAKEKHGGSFNKKQLIDASKEVFGGYGADMDKPMKTMEDVGNMGNAMAFIDGHYPVGMSGCYTVGINGGCGYGCPVFLDKECDNIGEFTSEEFEDSGDYDEDVDWYYWKCCEDDDGDAEASPERNEP